MSCFATASYLAQKGEVQASTRMSTPFRASSVSRSSRSLPLLGIFQVGSVLVIFQSVVSPNFLARPTAVPLTVWTAVAPGSGTSPSHHADR
jgi:hypothetical protein